MAEITNRQLNIYIQSGEAEKALERLTKKEKDLNDQLAKTSDPKQIAALKLQLDKLAEPISRAAKKLSGELAPSFRDLEAAARKYLNEYKKFGDPAALAQFNKFNQLLKEQKAVIDGVDAAQTTLTKKGMFTASFWANLAAQGVQRFTSAISGFFGGAISEALQADEATQRLASTLDNLGRSDVFDRLTRKAEMVADRFRYLDNDDVVAVFNKLIDYGKLTEKEMDNLLPVIIDFAAKSKISIDESASVIIKALAGNGRALKEYGIDIKDAGSEGERLNIILTTLKSKVEGSGDAFQKTAAGGIAVARQEFKNLQEDIGSLVIPALNKLLGFVSSALKGLKQFAKDVRDSFNVIGSTRDKFLSGPTQIGTDAAVGANDEFNKKIEGLDPKKKQEAIKKEIADQEYLQKLDAQRAQQAKFDGTYDDAKQAQDLAYRQKRLDLLKDTLAVETNLQKLGIDVPTPPATPSTKNNKDDLAAKKAAELKAYEDFIKKIKALDVDFEISQKDGFDKELALLMKKRDALNDEAKDFKDNKEALALIDENYRKEALALIDKYTLLDKQKSDKALKNLIKNVTTTYSVLASTLEKIFALNNRDKLAANELAVLTSRGKQKLKAELALLDEQKRQELQVKDLTENEKKLIEEKYRILKKEKEDQDDADRLQRILNFASQSAAIQQTFDQAKTNRENAELERERKVNDKKKANLDRLLKNKLISQQAYDRSVAAIDASQDARELDYRKKQFERNKRASIVQAFINGAQGATKTIAELGMPAAIPFLILEALAIAAQINLISSQKPKFARGKGPLDGLDHSSGGNPIIDGSTGQKIAEIERGEAITNKYTMADKNRYNVTGTPSQIISRLNSMHGGVSWATGASLVPAWKNAIPARINYTAVNNTLAKKYAAGGQFNTAGAPVASDAELVDAINMLRSVLAGGIRARVLLSDNEDAADRKAAIISDATLR